MQTKAITDLTRLAEQLTIEQREACLDLLADCLLVLERDTVAHVLMDRIEKLLRHTGYLR